MRDRKVVMGLMSLTVYELNSFGKYVHSPYFNVNQNINQYFNIIEHAIKNGLVDQLNPNEIWSQIFPSLPYHNQKFLKLNSDLLNLLENFLAQKEYEASEILQANFKLEGAKKRNITKLYNGIIGELERLRLNDINQSVEFYYNKYLIERNLFNLKTENEKKNEKIEISTELNIKDISDQLEYFYIAEKLRLYCTLLSWKKMYKLDMELGNMEYILNRANELPYRDIPAIKIYNRMSQTYSDESFIQNYFDLRNLTKKYLHLFPSDEQKEIYATLLSYCINKINKNQQDFFKETFEVYKDGLENGVLLLDGELSVTTYRNISIAALRVEEFSWAENFIYEYAKYVDEKYRNNAVEFSLARLEFYRKNFGKVIEHLYKVTYEDVWYNLGSKTLLIAAYFELDELDALESLLQAFKMFIKREKSLTNDRKETYLNLVKFTNQLIKIHPRDKIKLEKLKTEIEETKGVVSKPWLLEKVEHLLKKAK
jgi:hypothetical protein